MAVVDMIKGVENSVLGVWNPVKKYVATGIALVGGSILFSPLIGVPAAVAVWFIMGQNEKKPYRDRV